LTLAQRPHLLLTWAQINKTRNNKKGARTLSQATLNLSTPGTYVKIFEAQLASKLAQCMNDRTHTAYLDRGIIYGRNVYSNEARHDNTQHSGTECDKTQDSHSKHSDVRHDDNQ